MGEVLKFRAPPRPASLGAMVDQAGRIVRLATAVQLMSAALLLRAAAISLEQAVEQVKPCDTE